MTVPSEHLQSNVSCGKTGSSQDLARNNGLELKELADDCDRNESGGKLSNDTSSYSRERLQKVSEAWQSTIIDQNIRLARLSDDHIRPSLSFKRLKAESATIFATDITLVSDKEVFNLTEYVSFLLHEVYLYKNIIHGNYTNLKKILERDEAIVREILTQTNIPSAITKSLLDTHTKSSATFSDKSMLSPRVISSNTPEIVLENPVSANFTAQQCATSMVSLPISTNIPPLNATTIPRVPAIPLPDVTKPPPNFGYVANIAQPQRVLSNSYVVPPVPVNISLPSPYSNIPSCFSPQPPTLPQKTPMATILQASLKPSAASEYGSLNEALNELPKKIDPSTTCTFRRPVRLSPHGGSRIKRRYEVV